MELSLYHQLAPEPREEFETRFEVGHWEPESVAHPTGEPGASPAKFHVAQRWAHDASFEQGIQIIAMIAGTKGGKTSYGPWWLWDQIKRKGGGDYMAVTASYDLFHLKMLPAMIQAFVEILGVGKYWSQKRVIELCEPETGRFYAEKADDLMWGRIVLRSAEAKGGLESGDYKAIWADEAGQVDKFTLAAWRAIYYRRAALYDAPILLTTTLYDLGWIDSEIIAKVKKDTDRITEMFTQEETDAQATLNLSENLSIALIQFDSIINPLYPMKYFQAAADELPDEEFQAFHRGMRGTMRSLVYDPFDPVRDVIKPFQIPGFWDRWWGLDFGGAHLAATMYAEDPNSAEKREDRTLYCFANYLEGRMDIQEHVEKLRSLDDQSPKRVYGGAWSEIQWRREFRANGLPISRPTTNDFDIGINRVYAQHKRQRIIYFEGLPIIERKLKYRRKVDKQGEILDEIENKRMFHLIDSERYVIASIRKLASEKGQTVAW